MISMILRRIGPVLLILLLVSNAHANWSLQIATGAAYNFPTSLKIEEPGQNLDFTAHYTTHTFRSAPYYSVRVGRWQKNSAWEVELTHHKLYLTNLPPGIQQFNISNGYSMLTLNRAWQYHQLNLRAGGGALIAFPITTIQGVHTSGGYRLSGVAGQGSVEKRFYLGQNAFFAAEAKFTMAYASVDLKNAKAKVPNVALHGLAGFGYKF
jgi:hypothetical protein